MKGYSNEKIKTISKEKALLIEEIKQAVKNLTLVKLGKLKAQPAIDHWKAKGLDLSAILHQPTVNPAVARSCQEKQDHGLSDALDWKLIDLCKPALERQQPVRLDLPIRNVNRTVGTILSSEITRR